MRISVDTDTDAERFEFAERLLNELKGGAPAPAKAAPAKSAPAPAPAPSPAKPPGKGPRGR
jgi:hypothetical protein